MVFDIPIDILSKSQIPSHYSTEQRELQVKVSTVHEEEEENDFNDREDREEIRESLEVMENV